MTKGKKIQSFFKIFTNIDSTNEDLPWVTGIIFELHNLVISNHIDYFLGLVNADDENEDDSEDDDEEGEDEEDDD